MFIKIGNHLLPFVLSVGPGPELAEGKGPKSKDERLAISPFDFGLTHLRSGRMAHNVITGARRVSYFFSFLLFLTLALTGAKAMDGTEKYENYLNSIKTLSGDFTQRNSKGQTAQGKIQISRPGKMRLSYNPPSSLLIIADGKWLVTKNTQADEADYVSLENTPAAFILRPNVSFSGDVAVTSVIPKEDGTTEISLIRTEDPEAGYITLIFKDDPISLKGWRITDTQGETQVRLSNMQSNIQLPAGLFRFERPNLIQQIF